MDDKVIEWLKQADYELDTAKYMFSGGRYAYTVFMCHLAIEKALKGLYQHKLGNMPPKTHNLLYILTQLSIKPDKEKAKILAILNEANIAARYPESLEIVQKNYTAQTTSIVITQAEEVIKWIKELF